MGRPMCMSGAKGGAHDYQAIGDRHRSTQTMCCTYCGDSFNIDMKTGLPVVADAKPSSEESE